MRRLPPLAMCTIAAIIGGILAGGTAVHGLHPQSYGPADAPTLIHANDATPECEQCSDRDLGYRWAMLQDIRSSAQCPDDSWGFRRGCLDYTGGV